MTMKRLLSIIGFLILFGQISFGQVNNGLIELGKAYRQFMFRNNPPNEFLQGFEKFNPIASKGFRLAFVLCKMVV